MKTFSIFNCKKEQNGQNGFSLTSVVIALGLSSILALALASIISDSFKALKTIRVQADIVSLQSEVIRVFFDPSLCEKSLMGQAVKNSQQIILRRPSSIASPSPGSTPPPPPPPLLQAGSSYGDELLIKSVVLKNIVDIDTSVPNRQKKAALLEYVIDKGLGVYANNSNKIISMQIELIVDSNNKIVSCYGSDSPAQICSDLGGTYNSAKTPKCQVPPPKIQLAMSYSTFTLNCNGNVYSVGHVACPAGTTISNCFRGNPTYPSDFVVSKDGGFSGTMDSFKNWYNVNIIPPGSPGYSDASNPSPGIFPYGGCRIGYQCEPANPLNGKTLTVYAGCISN